MIQAFNLCKSYSNRTLFDNVTFAVGKGEIIGLVGRNGCGKSTLFKIILGQETQDSGTLSIPKGYHLGYLDQHIHFTKSTVLEECCQVLPEDEQYDFFKAEKLLFGLGFSEDDMHRTPQEFSGGYQLRINLVKSLLKNPDLLLLDEPTNYLDLLSLRWLSRFLKTFQGEVMLITHDKDFMDSVITHTMGISRGQLRKYKGNTDHYYEKVLLDEENYEKTRQNQDKKVKELQSFVDRFGAKASKATQAQSKMKQIQKIKVGAALSKEAILGFRFNYSELLSKLMLQVKDLGFSYDGDASNNLFQGLNFTMGPKDRVAVIGKNGKGKTTLLNVLAGQFPPTCGNYDFHAKIKLGYYQQTNRKDLTPGSTIADEISSSNVDLGISEVRSICGAMMFPGDDALKKIGVLSGGEQGRVLLGKILAQPSNFLLLDEPSNHLDMESIEVMTKEIRAFKGGVLFVTHNENMLRSIANKLIIFKEGSADFFDGNYDEFLEKIGWDDDDSSSKAKKNNVDSSGKKISYKEQKKLNRKKQSLEREIKRAEVLINQLEEDLKAKNKELEDTVSTGDAGVDVQAIYKSIGGIQEEIDASFLNLEKLSLELESLN
ncbi:MAG: ATP-binding cassette domain-containing protein [Bdellovibrionaceae bacterium]|jgi:ATP-binding cassette, subfamily F, member 3|nr:ATP-binding cassette domain-containing protein [Pseudobdellovibrionaceae bacterium]